MTNSNSHIALPTPSGKATALGEVACNALDTLLALQHHRAICRQCTVDERWCETARRYERNFMGEVQHYEQAKAKLT